MLFRSSIPSDLIPRGFAPLSPPNHSPRHGAYLARAPMKFSPKSAFAACLLVLVSCGGGADLETRSKDAVSDFVSVFEGIKDKESAEAAVSDLKAAVAKMKALSEETDKLSKEEKEAFETKMEEGTKELTTKMGTEMGRVMMLPGVAEILAPVMEELQKIYKN